MVCEVRRLLAPSGGKLAKQKRPDGSYRIAIDQRWSLDDLYVFSRNFEQAYFLAYSFLPELPRQAVGRVEDAFRKFPWRGGYSAVNFYNQLQVASQHRPTIRSIQYASPGILDLALLLPAAFTIGQLVRSIAKSIEVSNSTYHRVMTDLQERKLLRLKVRETELQLSKVEAKVIEEHAETMARLLGFDSHRQLTERTGNPFFTLKILLSYYRRLRTLAKFEVSGKARLPAKGHAGDEDDDDVVG